MRKFDESPSFFWMNRTVSNDPTAMPMVVSRFQLLGAGPRSAHGPEAIRTKAPEAAGHAWTRRPESRMPHRM